MLKQYTPNNIKYRRNGVFFSDSTCNSTKKTLCFNLIFKNAKIFFKGVQRLQRCLSFTKVVTKGFLEFRPLSLKIAQKFIIEYFSTENPNDFLGKKIDKQIFST